MESKKVEFFNKLSFSILLVTLILSLFFFIPFVPVTLEASKGFLISTGATLALFFWLIARLGEGKFSIPKDKIILAAASIPVVFLLASFFSSSKYISFFGSGFELGTFGSMLILFIIFFLSSIYFQTEKRLWSFYRFLFIGAIILAVFELINIFVGFGRFSPNLLKGISFGNLVGSWNDFAILFGLLVLVSISTIEFLKTKGFFLVMQYFLLVSGIFFLIIVNIPLVWILVGLFSIVIFVYSISIKQANIEIGHNVNGNKKFPFTSLIVVFIALIFLVGNSSVGVLVSRYLSVQNIDVRPSVSMTSKIALNAFKHNPFFGTGPNTFVIDWSLWQPKEVVADTVFWNVDFVNGFSSLMTFAVTTGILGLLAWLAFLYMFVRRVVKSLRKVLANTLSNYFIITTLIVSIYSWITVIVYTPNFIIFTLAFASSGMLIGIMVYNKTIESGNFSFLHDPRNSFFSILGLMVLMIVTLSTTYLYAEKFASIIYFSKGSTGGSSSQELINSENMLKNALLLDQNDVYYRTLSQIYIAEIGNIINDKSISQDTLKSSVQNLVNLAEQSAQAATNQNPKQYLNFMNLGNVYSAFVPLSVANSYESASAAYDTAHLLAPNNPTVLLAQANLEVANKNDDKAKSYIDQSLVLKPDYTDAMFLKAQIYVNEKDMASAIAEAELASQKAPTDATVFFRLGLLRYNNSDYTGAISAFEQAVRLDQTYLNAHFLLGEAYQKAGRIDDARAQFNALSQVLPNNQDVKNALSSLDSGSPITPSSTTPTNVKDSTASKTTKSPLPTQH